MPISDRIHHRDPLKLEEIAWRFKSFGRARIRTRGLHHHQGLDNLLFKTHANKIERMQSKIEDERNKLHMKYLKLFTFLLNIALKLYLIDAPGRDNYVVSKQVAVFMNNCLLERRRRQSVQRGASERRRRCGVWPRARVYPNLRCGLAADIYQVVMCGIFHTLTGPPTVHVSVPRRRSYYCNSSVFVSDQVSWPVLTTKAKDKRRFHFKCWVRVEIEL